MLQNPGLKLQESINCIRHWIILQRCPIVHVNLQKFILPLLLQTYKFEKLTNSKNLQIRQTYKFYKFTNLTNLQIGINFALVFESVEGLDDGVVVIGTCRTNSIDLKHTCKLSSISKAVETN
jgi:hypothetical protein